eukprot:763409-Hanusia_phi.AAC.10
MMARPGARSRAPGRRHRHVTPVRDGMPTCGKGLWPHRRRTRRPLLRGGARRSSLSCSSAAGRRAAATGAGQYYRATVT